MVFLLHLFLHFLLDDWTRRLRHFNAHMPLWLILWQIFHPASFQMLSNQRLHLHYNLLPTIFFESNALGNLSGNICTQLNLFLFPLHLFWVFLLSFIFQVQLKHFQVLVAFNLILHFLRQQVLLLVFARSQTLDQVGLKHVIALKTKS